VLAMSDEVSPLIPYTKLGDHCAASALVANRVDDPSQHRFARHAGGSLQRETREALRQGDARQKSPDRSIACQASLIMGSRPVAQREADSRRRITNKKSVTPSPAARKNLWSLKPRVVETAISAVRSGLDCIKGSRQ